MPQSFAGFVAENCQLPDTLISYVRVKLRLAAPMCACIVCACAVSPKSLNFRSCDDCMAHSFGVVV